MFFSFLVPQVGNALKTFGLGDDDTEILAVVLGSEEQVKDRLEKITNIIEGKVSSTTLSWQAFIY